MLFDLPSDAVLYDALIARDAGYDGRAWVGVTTTGVFCRPSCPARKPKAANCKWFDTAGGCIAAGFRPCKRCKPLHHMADPAVESLLSALDADPDRRWSQSDIVARGFNPSTIRRAFKRAFGMTLLDLARQRRLARGFTELSDGGRVVDAQVAAGFESGSAFRRAFTRWLGVRPGDLPADSLLRASWITTPLGDMVAVADQHSLHLLEFADRKALPTELKKLYQGHPISIGHVGLFDTLRNQLDQFFAGHRNSFSIPLTIHGTPYTQDVWRTLRTIPAGRTQTYAELAKLINKPNATRAVARANGANQIAILIPCHRIIGADGSLTGYGGGLWRKDRLIATEKLYATKGHIMTDIGSTFRALHIPGKPFVLANVWDAGSAKMLAAMGAQALATSSAAHAFTVGKPDGGTLTRDAALAHAQDIVAATSLPVQGDFENGFSDDPDTCAETVKLAAKVGLAGICIEDIKLPGDTAYDVDLAAERIKAAASAARAIPHDFVLTARADGIMVGAYDINEAIRRLRAFEAAGADCLYAPMPKTAADLAKITAAVSAPVNALVAGDYTKIDMAGYAKMNVARLSLGSALARITHRAIYDAAQDMLQNGGFTLLGNGISGTKVDALLSKVNDAPKT